MKNDPKNREDEEEQAIDTTAREAVQDFDSYKDYMREAKGDALNYGDY